MLFVALNMTCFGGLGWVVMVSICADAVLLGNLN